MANGRITLGKQSGGVLSLTFPDGATNTEVVLPESGTLARTSDINTAGVELKTIATGTATFTSTTNNINLTGVGVGVEIGDVIQISGSTNNNDIYTVEVISNANNIIVNQAHANKALTYSTGQRTKTLNGETSAVTIKLLAKWYDASIDLGRDWVDVTSSRTVGTQYANNTNRAFRVNLYGSQSAGTYLRLSVNGFVMSSGGTGSSQISSQISQIVPRNGKYTQSQDAGAAVSYYLELR